MSEKIVTLDVKNIPPSERHPSKILDAWDKVEVGETLRLLNDHDPKQLFSLFEMQYKDSFSWEYGEKGPVDWVINIKKIKKGGSPVSDLKKRVQEALQAVRPYLQADGGDVEIVNVDEASMIVSVRLVGACGGCPSAGMTLKAGVERAIRERVPEIMGVEAV